MNKKIVLIGILCLFIYMINNLEKKISISIEKVGGENKEKKNNLTFVMIPFAVLFVFSIVVIVTYMYFNNTANDNINAKGLVFEGESTNPTSFKPTSTPPKIVPGIGADLYV